MNDSARAASTASATVAVAPPGDFSEGSATSSLPAEYRPSVSTAARTDSHLTNSGRISVATANGSCR